MHTRHPEIKYAVHGVRTPEVPPRDQILNGCHSRIRGHRRQKQDAVHVATSTTPRVVTADHPDEQTRRSQCPLVRPTRMVISSKHGGLSITTIEHIRIGSEAKRHML